MKQNDYPLLYTEGKVQNVFVLCTSKKYCIGIQYCIKIPYKKYNTEFFPYRNIVSLILLNFCSYITVNVRGDK